MSQRLTYLRLEIKRALLRLPQLAAGAVLLLLFLGLAAGFAGERLYGDSAFGRMTIGVVLAEEDEQEKMLVQMLSHMESVESICDFQYMTEEEAEEAFQKHQIYGALYLPEGLIQGIMNGSNPPIQVRLEGGGLENRIFKELTQAGARILGAAQAGIYAGDQLLHEYEMDERIGQLEQELNEIYINNSLSRESLFQERQVSATGDLSPLQFYGASILILYLLFLAVPVSSYLKPESTVMAQKLKLLGIGAWTGTAARLAGLWILMVIGAVPFFAAACRAGIFQWSFFALGVLALLCLGTASVALFIFEAAGNGMGGIMLLFLGAVVLHLFSGGILPSVFLPGAVRNISVFLPNAVLIKAAGLLSLGSEQWMWCLPVAGMILFFYILTVGVRRR